MGGYLQLASSQTILIPLVLVAVGVALSPVAGHIAHRTAERYELHGARYMIMGAVYWMLLLMPWFLMIASLRNRELPGALLGPIYLFVYVIWLVGPIGLGILLIASESEEGNLSLL